MAAEARWRIEAKVAPDKWIFSIEKSSINWIVCLLVEEKLFLAIATNLGLAKMEWPVPHAPSSFELRSKYS